MQGTKELVVPVTSAKLEVVCECGSSLTIPMTKETHTPEHLCTACNNPSDDRLKKAVGIYRQFLEAVGESSAIRFRVQDF